MADLIAPSTGRVEAHTADAVNERNRRDTEMRVRGYATRPEAELTRRIQELDAEWDVERCLQTGASMLTLFGTAMGATVSRKWFALPTAVMGFFLQHGVQGWCPPIEVFRRLGVRTADEIAEERYALKALRGDFDDVEPAAATAPGGQ
jgi:hypothetical protein